MNYLRNANHITHMHVQLKQSTCPHTYTYNLQYMYKCTSTQHLHVYAQKLTLLIITFPEFQERSLGILAGGDMRTMTAATTLTTAPGGFEKDLSSVRLFLFSVFRAVSAACMRGWGWGWGKQEATCMRNAQLHVHFNSVHNLATMYGCT